MASMSMKEMEAAKAKLAKELAELEERLHAERLTKAEEEFERLYAEFEPLVPYLSTRHKNTLIRLMEGSTRSRSQGGEGGVQPKFEVNGTAWSGRGRTPTAFADWDKSDEGKAWRKANPKQRYPFHKDYSPTEADRNWSPAPAPAAKSAPKKNA